MIPHPRPVVVAGLLAALFAGCSAEAPRPKSILVITMDTTRSDHLGCYGYPLPITPHVDGLAERGVLFERAYAPMPQTLPSHVTLFTGLQPRDHGVLENAFTAGPEIDTMAEALAAEGYDTAAFVGALALQSSTGIDQGFDVFDQPSPAWRLQVPHPAEREADSVTDSALAWADTREGDAPFLLWAHYYDPHHDFAAPRKHQREIPPGRVLKDVVSQRSGLFKRFRFSVDEITEFWHGYAAEVRFTDAQIGRLLDGLDERGMLDDTVIVLAGDHGEGLFEHGQKGHGTHVWEEMLLVPLIIVHPDERHAGLRVDARVTLADIAPTVLGMALGPAGTTSAAAGDGLDLWSVLERGARFEDRPVFLERPHFSRDRIEDRGGIRNADRMLYGFHVAVVAGDHKLIREPDGEVAVYDLVADPDEHEDLADSEPEVRRRLEQLLDGWTGAHPVSLPGDELQLSDERIEALRALGYLGDG